jgi:hypothetical protein
VTGSRYAYSSDRTWRITLLTWTRDKGIRRSAGASIVAEQQLLVTVGGMRLERFRRARAHHLSLAATFHSPGRPPFTQVAEGEWSKHEAIHIDWLWPSNPTLEGDSSLITDVTATGYALIGDELIAEWR